MAILCQIRSNGSPSPKLQAPSKMAIERQCREVTFKSVSDALHTKSFPKVLLEQTFICSSFSSTAFPPKPICPDRDNELRAPAVLSIAMRWRLRGAFAQITWACEFVHRTHSRLACSCAHENNSETKK